MWLLTKHLKKKYDIPNPRRSLYGHLNEWVCDTFWCFGGCIACFSVRLSAAEPPCGWNRWRTFLQESPLWVATVLTFQTWRSMVSSRPSAPYSFAPIFPAPPLMSFQGPGTHPQGTECSGVTASLAEYTRTCWRSRRFAPGTRPWRKLLEHLPEWKNCGAPRWLGTSRIHTVSGFVLWTTQGEFGCDEVSHCGAAAQYTHTHTPRRDRRKERKIETSDDACDVMEWCKSNKKGERG